MNERLAQPTMITTVALAAYGGLIALALLVASWWGVNPWGSVTWTTDAVDDHLIALGHGALAAMPLVVLLILFDRWTPHILLPLKQSVDREVVPLLVHSNVGDFLLISIAAGLGEELFFRGVLQAGLLQELQNQSVPYAVAISIAAASLLFGICHWVNREYAVVAAIIGVYFGVLYYYTNSLLTPIAAHAVYDFVAMCYLVIFKQRQRHWPGTHSA